MGLISELPDDRRPDLPADRGAPDPNTRFDAFPEDAVVDVTILDQSPVGRERPGRTALQALGHRHVRDLFTRDVAVIAILTEVFAERSGNVATPIGDAIRTVASASRTDIPYFVWVSPETLSGSTYRKVAFDAKMDALHIPSRSLTAILQLAHPDRRIHRLVNRLAIVRDRQIVSVQDGGKDASTPFNLDAFTTELQRQFDLR